MTILPSKPYQARFTVQMVRFRLFLSKATWPGCGGIGRGPRSLALGPSVSTSRQVLLQGKGSLSHHASYRELPFFLFTLYLMFLRVPLCVEEEALAIFYCFFCPFGHRVDALAEIPGPTDVPSAACWCIYRVTAQGPTSAPGLAALPHGVGNTACGLLGSLKGQKGCISLRPEAGRTWRWPAKSARAS